MAQSDIFQWLRRPQKLVSDMEFPLRLLLSMQDDLLFEDLNSGIVPTTQSCRTRCQQRAISTQIDGPCMQKEPFQLHFSQENLRRRDCNSTAYCYILVQRVPTSYPMTAQQNIGALILLQY